MNIELSTLDFSFSSPPLLIGGKAMEFYELRPAGADIDFVIRPDDYARLAARYPAHLKDLWGDLGVCIAGYEIWQSICLFDYDFLSLGAIQQAGYCVISLEKLLFLKAMAMKIEKYHHDLELVVEKILKDKYDPWWVSLSPEKQQQYLNRNAAAAL